MKISAREVAIASIFGALSFLWEVIPGPPFDIPFPPYPRISWDITGVPMMISLLLFGPVIGVYTCLVGCSIIFLRGNVPGGIFKVVAELATLLAYASVRRGVVASSIAATLSRVVVMTIANYFLLPFFYRIPVDFVVGLLPAIAVFNASQALINIIPSYVIHQRLRNFIRR